jgi:hypothetical protein
VFEQSIAQLKNAKYLGSLPVVDRLVREFVNEVMTANDPSEAIAAVNRIAAIFAGLDDSYTAPRGWLSRDTLGRQLSVTYAINHNQSMIDICRSAFAKLTAQLYKQLQVTGGDEAAMRPFVDDNIERMVLTLMNAGQLTGKPK